MHCEFCDKVLKKQNALSTHQKYCKQNTNRASTAGMGGYRERSGRAKTGYFRSIYCGSTYELVWLIYQLDHDRLVKRFEGKLEHAGTSYIPDFIQDGIIVELKGFEDQESVDKKTAVANNNGYVVKVLRKDDLITEFSWVKENYEYKHVWELYDEYKPKHTYACATCNNVVERESKSKYDKVFCNRSCASSWWKGKTRPEFTSEHKRKISESLIRTRYSQ